MFLFQFYERAKKTITITTITEHNTYEQNEWKKYKPNAYFKTDVTHYRTPRWNVVNSTFCTFGWKMRFSYLYYYFFFLTLYLFEIHCVLFTQNTRLFFTFSLIYTHKHNTIHSHVSKRWIFHTLNFRCLIFR